MAKTYDLINKNKQKYESMISDRDAEILTLKEKNKALIEENKNLRQTLYDHGLGKGEIHHLKGVIKDKERENKTLENKLKIADGTKLISTFSPERQALIKRIRSLSFTNKLYNLLAIKFKNGLDNVIEIAALIKTNSAVDMDYYTFVFRDDIIGLLEKMLNVVLNQKELSASRYLAKVVNKCYTFPKEYCLRIPELKDLKVIQNILYLINLQSTAYHGTKLERKRIYTNSETEEVEKPDKFLNLSNEEQLTAIFTLLKFMYDVFTNKNAEINLQVISQSWFTIL